MTGCVVDSKSYGFQCYNKKNKDGYFMTLKEGKDLLCTSPEEMESFLKECKQGRVVLPTTCSYEPSKDIFLCSHEDGIKIEYPVDQLDNFFCMSSQDFRRVKERCQSSVLYEMQDRVIDIQLFGGSKNVENESERSKSID